jgi:L-lactate dehydrogenase complex protein LldG
MNGREQILKAITANKPGYIALPDGRLDRADLAGDMLVSRFIKTLESIGGKTFLVADFQSIQTQVMHQVAAGEFVVNTISEAGDLTSGVDINSNAQTLESIDVAFIRGTLAVAENGAVWIKETQLVNRLLPFICQHLVLVVAQSSIVPTMHEAYDKINIAEEGYGVFIAGPSKTADIEQSLVIGAHGARSLTVYLVNE